ncbi:hypothetical protein MYX76_03700 [Desulfobacterota bacterium AH_259_B03_O07]|nr:hypothetical protein [Desulfobacterota bacterium AH_259_B03_O07]
MRTFIANDTPMEGFSKVVTFYQIIAHEITSEQDTSNSNEGSIIGAFVDPLTLIKRYCEDEVQEKISLLQNIHLKNVLVLITCNSFREFNKRKEYYELKTIFWQDIELPSWEKFILEVSMDLSTFEEESKLWDEVVKIVNESLNEYQRESGVTSDIIYNLRKQIGTSINVIQKKND